MRVLAILTALLLSTATASELPAPSAVPGGVALLPLAGAGAPQAFLGEDRVLVVPDGQGWQAVVGIPLGAAPGEHRLSVRWPDGEEREYAFEVSAKDYPVQRLTIPDDRKVNPSQQDLERIWREQQISREAVARWSERRPDLDFIAPVDGRFSGSFGLRRILNDQPRSPHRGMDIAAPEGTPVLAAAAGRVEYVGDFFFSGQVVYLDHGNGVHTLYAHLARVDVRPGQELAKGEVLGTVGKTGRATGPHLHWSVYLNTEAVDPALFIPERVLASRAGDGASSDR